MSKEGNLQPSNTFISEAPNLEEGVRDLASAKLAAVNDYYEARAKISRLNAQLFDKGFIVGHDLMCW